VSKETFGTYHVRGARVCVVVLAGGVVVALCRAVVLLYRSSAWVVW